MEQFLLQTSSAKDLIEHPLFSKYLKNDQFLFELIKKEDFDDYSMIAPFLKNKPFFYLKILAKNPSNIEYIPKKLLNNSSFLIAALDTDINIAKYIHEEFNRSISLTKWFCWRYSSSRPLKYLPVCFSDNYKIGKNLVMQNSINYVDLSPRLKNIKTIYEIATSKTNISSIFIYSGEKIKLNKNICYKAIASSYRMYNHINPKLKENPLFFIKLLNLNHHFLELAPDSIQCNLKCVFAAVKKNPLSIVYSSTDILSNLAFAIKVKKAISASDFKYITRFFSKSVQEKLKHI